jgi:voltage-gated potassium channel
MFKLKISKSLITYVSIFAFLVLIYSFIFNYLMHTYESKDYSFITAIYWVIVSMTTVGYGEIIFLSPVGQIFTVVVVLSGVVMIFGYLFPLVVTPQLEKTLRRELPSRVPVDFRNHIIICGYNQLVETLIVELDEDRIPFVVVDENEHTIHHLMARKIFCVHGEASNDNVLLKSNIRSARILIANQNDEKNASIILTAKELCNIKVIALVEDIAKERYLKYAGADQVISPKTLFGTYIGKKAVDPLTDHLAGATRFFENLNIVEFPIYPGSALISTKLKDAKIRKETGANIVGLWTRGRLSLNPGPDDIIKESSVLLAVGNEKQLEALKKLTR